jgi:hypothetical protein
VCVGCGYRIYIKGSSCFCASGRVGASAVKRREVQSHKD